MTRELLQQALGALEIAVRQNQHDMLMTGEECRSGEGVITALQAALAQPVQPAERQPMTEEEVLATALQSGWPSSMLADVIIKKLKDFVRAIEAHHKIGEPK